MSTDLLSFGHPSVLLVGFVGFLKEGYEQSVKYMFDIAQLFQKWEDWTIQLINHTH